MTVETPYHEQLDKHVEIYSAFVKDPLVYRSEEFGHQTLRSLHNTAYNRLLATITSCRVVQIRNTNHGFVAAIIEWARFLDGDQLLSIEIQEDPLPNLYACKDFSDAFIRDWTAKKAGTSQT